MPNYLPISKGKQQTAPPKDGGEPCRPAPRECVLDAQADSGAYRPEGRPIRLEVRRVTHTKAPLAALAAACYRKAAVTPTEVPPIVMSLEL